MSEEKSPKAEDFIAASDEINVEEIMADIRKRIQEKKDSGVLKQKDIDEIEDMELLPLPDFLDVPNFYTPHLYPDHKLENYHPIPPEPEVTSGGLRGLVKRILGRIRHMLFPMIRFLVRPITNDIVIHRHNENKKSIAYLTPFVIQSKEYIILLHNAMNNMIVESSKAKIEQELLKTKIKVLEDKVEFLEKRERAVEKKLFQT